MTQKRILLSLLIKLALVGALLISLLASCGCPSEIDSQAADAITKAKIDAISLGLDPAPYDMVTSKINPCDTPVQQRADASYWCTKILLAQ